MAKKRPVNGSPILTDDEIPPEIVLRFRNIADLFRRVTDVNWEHRALGRMAPSDPENSWTKKLMKGKQAHRMRLIELRKRKEEILPYRF